MAEMKVFDGKGLILGRLSTAVAKELLGGTEVAIVNAEQLVISGRPESTVQKYASRRTAKDKADPEHSPHWPRKPELLVKRIVRGMLPWYKATGRDAFKRLRVYEGVPPALEKSKKVSPKEASKEKLEYKMITISELCKRLGYTG